jgi:hypothetical protein
MLQVVWWGVRFQIRSFDFPFDLILPAALCHREQLSP